MPESTGNRGRSLQRPPAIDFSFQPLSYEKSVNMLRESQVFPQGTNMTPEWLDNYIGSLQRALHVNFHPSEMVSEWG